MEGSDALLISTIVSMAIMFVVLNAMAKYFGNEAYKIYYRLYKRKKIQKILADGWKLVGVNAKGYPVTFEKDNNLLVV